MILPPSPPRACAARSWLAAPRLSLWALCLSAGAALAGNESPTLAFEEAEEILVLDEDEGEIIIIEEDPPSKADATPPRITGALGRLWEAWHIGVDSEVGAQAQRVEPEDSPWRLRLGLALETWLLPAPNLSFYANGFGRLFVDVTPDTVRVLPLADVYEAYAQVNLGVGSVQLGRLVVPWGRTGALALGDRLNPPDLRRGVLFPDPVAGKQPQYGAVLRTSLGALGVEGVLFTAYEPSEGSLSAANQGGVRIGRYQGALIRSPARFDGLGRLYDRRPLLAEPETLLDATVLAGRLRRRLGDFDLGGSIVYGIDETPALDLPIEVSRFLGREGLVALGVPPRDLPVLPCSSDAELEATCLGGPGALSHERNVSLSLDVAWGLGVVILKTEAVAYPRLFGLPGKTALLVDAERGLVSAVLGHYGVALAAEGALGDFVSGSIEVFDLFWNDVPANTLLWGVELFESDTSQRRQVHRFGLAGSLGGTLLEERLRWSVRGEAGILQRDVLLGAQVRYRLPLLDLYVGGEGALFAGFPGSPGWLRQDASTLGIFVGEGR